MKPLILISILPLLLFATSCGNQSPEPNQSLQYLSCFVVSDVSCNNRDTLKYGLAEGFLDLVASAKPIMPVKAITIATIELVSPNKMDTIEVRVLGDCKTLAISTGRYYEASESLLLVKRITRKGEVLDSVKMPCPVYNYDSLAKYNFPYGFTSSSSNRPSFALHCDAPAGKYGVYHIITQFPQTADVFVAYQKQPWRAEDSNQTILGIIVYRSGFKGLGDEMIGRKASTIAGLEVDSTTNMAYLRNEACTFVFSIEHERVKQFAYIPCATSLEQNEEVAGAIKKDLPYR